MEEMTIIVATSWGGKASIASDSAGTYEGLGLQTISGTKLKKYPFGTVGFSGSYALLSYLDPALRKCKGLETERHGWQLTRAFREALKEAGWENQGGESLPSMNSLYLVALTPSGKIWTFHGDFAAIRERNIAVTGSGMVVAFGAAEAFRRSGMPADQAAAAAAKVACDHIASCGGRVHTRCVYPGAKG